MELDAITVRRAAELLAGARAVCVLSGAGMSAESGVPTFRDPQGLWDNFRPEEVASPEAFARDPRRVWEWYRLRRTQLGTIEPHEGHRVLATWERRCATFALVTQNVDGLHHRAGSQHVLELHGRLDRLCCTGCAYEVIGLEDLGAEPHCPECGGWLRPGVVWFGEMLPMAELQAAEVAATTCDVLLSIGTSGVVYPAVGLIEVASAEGAAVIEINPQETPHSGLAAVCLRSGCKTALTAVEEVWGAG